MNIVNWISENLTARCALMQCYLNIGGQTYDADVVLAKEGNYRLLDYVHITYDKTVLKVYLGDLSTFNGVLYYFEQANGIGATLVIPNLPQDEEEE